MTHCTSRRVERFYFNGRGYNSKLSAYKAAAKEDLLTRVFGEFCKTCEVREDGEPTGGREKLHGLVYTAQRSHYKIVGGSKAVCIQTQYVDPAQVAFSAFSSQNIYTRCEAVGVALGAIVSVPDQTDFDWDAAMKEVFAAGMRDFGFECDQGNSQIYPPEPPEWCCPERFMFCGLEVQGVAQSTCLRDDERG